VWLTRADGSELCRAELFAKSTPRAEPAAPTVSSVNPDIAGGIKRLGPNEFAIDRGTRDRILETQQELMSHARITPETIDGRVVGVRLSFKPDSLLGMIGFINGDRLDAINGMELSSPEAALQAFARLRNAERLAVKISRGGQPTTLDYTIR
jgi:general secretion pathway protein C